MIIWYLLIVTIPDCVYTQSLYWTYDIHLTTHTESIALSSLSLILVDCDHTFVMDLS